MEVILVFTTGRSGTAFLAQYFAGALKNKSEYKIRKNVAIAHEPFDKLEEYWKAIFSIKRGEDPTVIDFLIKELKKNEKCDKFFITDNKLGRWFWKSFLSAGIKTKIIYLFRNEKNVIKSLRRSTRKHGKEWLYQPNDKYSLTNCTLDPLLYHIKETSAQWIEARKKLRPEQYIEVSFEHFLTSRNERKKLESFIGLSGYEHLLKRRINVSFPILGFLGYTTLKKYIIGYPLRKIKKILNVLSHHN